MKRCMLLLTVFAILFNSSGMVIADDNKDIEISRHIGADGITVIASYNSDSEFVFDNGTEFIKTNILFQDNGKFIVSAQEQLSGDGEYVLRDTNGNSSKSFSAAAQNNDVRLSVTKSESAMPLIAVSSAELTEINSDSVKLMDLSDNTLIDVSASVSGNEITVEHPELKKQSEYALMIVGALDADGNTVCTGTAFLTEAAEDIVLTVKSGENAYYEYGEGFDVWHDSGVKGYDGLLTRYAGSKQVATYAKWTPDIQFSGEYEVFIWNVNYAESDDEPSIIINTGGGEENIGVMPFDLSSAKKGFWWSAGTYYFEQSSDCYVKMLRNNNNTTLRTSAVKFVPIHKAVKPSASIEYNGNLNVKFDTPMETNLIHAQLVSGEKTENVKLISADCKNYSLCEGLLPDTEYTVSADGIKSYENEEMSPCGEAFKTDKQTVYPVIFDSESSVFAAYSKVKAYLMAYSIENGVISEYKVTEGTGRIETELASGNAVLLSDLENFKPFGNGAYDSELTIESGKYSPEEYVLTASADGYSEGEKVIAAITKDSEPMYIDVLNMPSDGKLVWTYKISDKLDGGEYNVILNSQTSDKEVKTSFYNINETTIKKAIEELNNAKSEAEVEEVILKKHNELNLAEREFELYKSLKDKSGINNALFNKNFENTDKISSIFKNEISLNAVNQLSEYDTYFNNYYDVYGIDLKNYSALKNKEDVFTVFKNELPIKELSGVKTAFERSVAAAMINQNSYGAYEEILNTYADSLGINMTKFNALTESKKSSVLKAIAQKKNYSSAKALVSEFNNALSGTSTVPSGGSSGGGGGGGGFQAMPVSSPQPTEEPEKIYGFKDLDEAEWAKSSILELMEKGIAEGYPDKTFHPNENITREGFVKLIVSAFGIGEENSECSFEDISKDDWSYPYVARALKSGIVNGVSENTFGKGKNLMRQDMAVITNRVIKLKNIRLASYNTEINYTDAADIAEYAAEPISELQKAGLISGTGDRIFEPHAYATRAMVSKLICDVMHCIE